MWIIFKNKEIITCFIIIFLQFPILGFKNIINNLTRDDLVKYHSKFYIPSNCIISICGDVDEDLLIKTIESYLPDNDEVLERNKVDNIEISSNVIVNLPPLTPYVVEVGASVSSEYALFIRSYNSSTACLILNTGSPVLKNSSS